METFIDINIPLNIRKLSVVLTEKCNLECIYCYARLSGRWDKNISMSKEVAKLIIDKIVAKSNSCDFIQFFGGEPTLNLPIINYMVTEIDNMSKNGIIMKRPKFGIVTNGSFKNKNLLYEIIEKYNIETTISIDGPEFINDRLRINKNGSSSYNIVRKSIEEMINLNLKVALEIVYTAIHIKHRYSIVDCFNFVKDTGANKIIFQSAYPPADKYINPLSPRTINKFLEYYMEAVDWWFNELIHGEPIDVYFKEILKMMLNGTSTLVTSGCPAGWSDFSVGPNGDVYPCQLLYGKNEFIMGNILNGNFKCIPKKHNLIHSEFNLCKSCFARHWCQPCAALNEFFGNIFTPPSDECMIRKSVILRIAQWTQNVLKLPENEYSAILENEITKL
jgi:uncharacterized protein